MSAETTKTYSVEGMSCAHCVAAVRDEVGTVSGVGAVDIDLVSGRVSVRGDFEDAAVRAAIGDAGYEATA